MVGFSPRLSIACLYNMKSAHQKQVNSHDDDNISPLSTVQGTPIPAGSKIATVSPVDTVNTTTTYFPDEKIAIPVEAYDGIEVAPRRPSRGLEVVSGPTSSPQYTVGGPQVNYANADAKLPDRPAKKPFWKRHFLWIFAVVLLLVILISALAGLVLRPHNKDKKVTVSATIRNSTLHSVASTGLLLKDGRWNMHLFTQNTTGGITLRMSLDGDTYQPYRNVSLTIPPKIGSPLTATVEQDTQTGVIMINLFYLSGNDTVSNITASAITCPAGSTNCGTVNNSHLPTKVPVNVYTGLTAVNVNNSQDWRVYYLDKNGAVSQLEGNGSGFTTGEQIGGSGLNASSLAAVNVNSTTNNINLFYVDSLTRNLFKMQLINGVWTSPSAVSTASIPSWNPYSGLGAAYSSTQDQLHVYYTGLDLGIYEFLGSNVSKTTNTSWLQVPGRNHVWATADYASADIAAVGWQEHVRFYQVKQGRMVEGSLVNKTWTEAFMSS